VQKHVLVRPRELIERRLDLLRAEVTLDIGDDRVGTGRAAAVIRRIGSRCRLEHLRMPQAESDIQRRAARVPGHARGDGEPEQFRRAAVLQDDHATRPLM
jgi:hypothetical protein